MNVEKLDLVLKLVVEFAQSRKDIHAVGLCGSWAKEEARIDSDIDLSIIVEDKMVFKSTDWIEQFPFHKIQDSLKSYRDDVYGLTWSRHAFLKSGIEIEYGFADKSWAHTNPIDAGTRKVVSDGYKILLDPEGILENLLIKL